jgi:poly-gamma-glutamate synthesis protein (capsule biosynthesis protein)
MTRTAVHEAAEPLTLALAGDVMLGRLVNDTLREHGWGYPWGDLGPVLHSVDAFLINLECAITNGVVRWHNGHYKPFYFRADPGAIETLRLGRVDFASLANNHIQDFGPKGMLDTIEVLDLAGIAHAGAGRDAHAARAPAILTVRGHRIAIVAFADYPQAWAAMSDSPGLNFTSCGIDDEAFEPVASAVAEARTAADLVIFSIHWGPNMRDHPSAEFRHFAHRVLDAGATVFWGHSAHVVQGVEWGERGRVILYDTGDLVDDYAVDRYLRNDLGALFQLYVHGDVVNEVRLVPVRIDRMQVNLASDDDRQWFTRRFEALCRDLGSGAVARPDGSISVWAAPHVIAAQSEVG